MILSCFKMINEELKSTFSMTTWIAVECPHCHSTDVVKNGFSGEGKQRYLCQNQECNRRSFIVIIVIMDVEKKLRKKF